MVLKSLKKEDQSKLCFNKCYGKKIQQNITFILLVTGPTQGVVKSILVKRGQKKGRSLINNSESAVPPSPLTVAELYHSDLSKEEYLEQNHGIQKSSHKASFLFCSSIWHIFSSKKSHGDRDKRGLLAGYSAFLGALCLVG